MERIAVSPAEAARLLGVDKAHLYAAIERGELVAVSIGRKSLIDIQDLRAWLKSRPATKSSRRKQKME